MANYDKSYNMALVSVDEQLNTDRAYYTWQYVNIAQKAIQSSTTLTYIERDGARNIERGKERERVESEREMERAGERQRGREREIYRERGESEREGER